MVTGSTACGGRLAEAQAAIRESDKPRDTDGWIGELPKALKPLRTQLARDLAEQGILREERHKFLGISTGTRYPEVDCEPEQRLRERLRGVLMSELEPDPSYAALAGLLVPYQLDRELVEKDQRKVARARAEELGADSPASAAVAAAVRRVQAGVSAALMASTTAATTAAVIN